jgi:hypothetical protein
MPITFARFSFLLKIGVTIALVVAFNWLFPNNIEGVGIGIFALAWLLGVILGRRAVRRPRLDIAIAFALAAIFCMSLAYDPGPLAWVMFWSALSIATLLPRMRRFDDAWRWVIRLLLQGVTGIAKPVIDLIHALAAKPRGARRTFGSLVALLALPIAGTALFTALFAIANPVIEDMLGHIQLPSPGKIIEWTFATILVWPALRPHPIVTRLHLPEPSVGLPGASLPSVLTALALFNALFAVQNGLDVAFLWSGAPLPPGMTMTEYVHRGAYPLIATALLAGLFVLTMLRPGTTTASNKAARRLVALWVAQNLFLVASSALRTIDYIIQYELTAWRIAALLWMALVATGLILICWRMWFGRSTRWLINANALAAGFILVPCCFGDLDASAALWNVDHAREVGGTGQSIDLCYLRNMGDPALLAVAAFERRALTPELRDRVRYVRSDLFANLEERQSHWWSWTPHGAMRLTRARTLLGPNSPVPAPIADNSYRACDGSPAHRE